MLYPFPVGAEQRGRISPVTPGCQTFVTVAEADGSLSKTNTLQGSKENSSCALHHFIRHNTGKKALSCVACHGNPAFLGFGQHVIEGGQHQGDTAL